MIELEKVKKTKKKKKQIMLTVGQLKLLSESNWEKIHAQELSKNAKKDLEIAQLKKVYAEAQYKLLTQEIVEKSKAVAEADKTITIKMEAHIKLVKSLSEELGYEGSRFGYDPETGEVDISN